MTPNPDLGSEPPVPGMLDTRRQLKLLRQTSETILCFKEHIGADITWALNTCAFTPTMMLSVTFLWQFPSFVPLVAYGAILAMARNNLPAADVKQWCMGAKKRVDFCFNALMDFIESMKHDQNETQHDSLLFLLYTIAPLALVASAMPWSKMVLYFVYALLLRSQRGRRDMQELLNYTCGLDVDFSMPMEPELPEEERERIDILKRFIPEVDPEEKKKVETAATDLIKHCKLDANVEDGDITYDGEKGFVHVTLGVYETEYWRCIGFEKLNEQWSKNVNIPPTWANKNRRASSFEDVDKKLENLTMSNDSANAEWSVQAIEVDNVNHETPRWDQSSVQRINNPKEEGWTYATEYIRKTCPPTYEAVIPRFANCRRRKWIKTIKIAI